MNTYKVAIAGITGTSFMTAYSHILSEINGSNYSEPEILSELLNRITPLHKNQSRLFGWVAHYAVGLAFAALYAQYLKAAKIKPGFVNAVTFGALGGVAGILAWKQTLKAHPNPPGVDLETFYKQLLPAHIIFSIAVAAVYSKQKPVLQ